MVRDVGIAIAWLAVALPILAGLYGIWSLFRPPVRMRNDRLRGIGCSVAVAAVTSVIFGYFGHLLGRGMIVGYANSLLDDVLLVAPIGALFGLAAIGGYAFVARRVEGPASFLGLILGPVALVLAPVGVASTITRAAGY
jgi:hypothetical protein